MVQADRRRWWALGALVLAVLTLGLDVTVLNVALPRLAADLSAGTGALQWMVNAYVLVFAGLMLPAGALGDRYGRKRLLVAGLVLFGVASLVAAWSDSAGVLIAVRAVMGLGGAVIMPIVLAAGPIVGGWLLEHFWWGSIFLINVPVVAVAWPRSGCCCPGPATRTRRGPTCPAGCCPRPGWSASSTASSKRPAGAGAM